MKRIVIAVILTIFLLIGCVGLKTQGSSTLFEFINDGQTSRTDVILKLGEPSASLESGRILTYRTEAMLKKVILYVKQKTLGLTQITALFLCLIHKVYSYHILWSASVETSSACKMGVINLVANLDKHRLLSSH